jgi:hypothetical protein
MSIVKTDYREQLLEKLKQIDTDKISDDVEIVTSSKVLEEQKVYFWIRLYLSEEDHNVQTGDTIVIQYEPSGEVLDTTFVCYGKKGLERNHNDEVVNYNPDDDRKILCLMVDERIVNFGDGIPFIRTLFKTGYHYEYQLVKRNELLFINKRNGFILDYYDCDF